MPGGKWTGYGTLVPSAVGFWPGAQEPGSFTGSFHQGLMDKPILTSIGLPGGRIPHGIGATLRPAHQCRIVTRIVTTPMIVYERQ